MNIESPFIFTEQTIGTIWGYSIEGCTINETKAEIVREIFKRLIVGESLCLTGIDLSRCEIPIPLGCKWSSDASANTYDDAIGNEKNKTGIVSKLMQETHPQRGVQAVPEQKSQAKQATLESRFHTAEGKCLRIFQKRSGGWQRAAKFNTC